MDDTGLSLDDYLDSLTEEEKNICPLCEVIEADNGFVVCQGESADVKSINDLSIYDNNIYQQYLREDDTPTTKEYQEYVKALNGGTFYKITEEQIDELSETGLAGWGGYGRVSGERLAEEGYYFRPVIVNDEVVQVLTNDG